MNEDQSEHPILSTEDISTDLYRMMTNLITYGSTVAAGPNTSARITQTPRYPYLPCGEPLTQHSYRQQSALGSSNEFALAMYRQLFSNPQQVGTNQSESASPMNQNSTANIKKHPGQTKLPKNTFGLELQDPVAGNQEGSLNFVRKPWKGLDRSIALGETRDHSSGKSMNVYRSQGMKNQMHQRPFELKSTVPELSKYGVFSMEKQLSSNLTGLDNTTNAESIPNPHAVAFEGMFSN